MPDPTGRISHLPEMHRGVSWKQPVHLATTADVGTPVAVAPGDTLDGVTVGTAWRILVKDQALASMNGIYVAAGTAYRDYDMDQDASTSVPASEVLGAFVYVLQGTENGGKVFYTTNTTGPTIGTDDIDWAEWTTGTAASGTAYVTKTDGGSETVYTANTGTAFTVNIEAGNWQDLTLTGNCVFTFTGADNGEGDSFVMLLRQDGTGGRTVTWPGAVEWPDATAPTLGTAAAAVNILTFLTRDGGSTWFGFMAGSGDAGTPGTPSLTFSTTNAIGSSTDFVAKDATIALFDATAPTTAAFGDAAAAGSAGYAAHRDHRHGMPAEPTSSGGALMISDTHSSPLVFDDILQSDAGDDFLYMDS